ncbi:DNRLRE domain-containing protein [Microbacterium sp. 1P10AE]|uniref:CBM96 family carbohydrate-binding protein n=1 Tax=Microbacterium sp. 1P10AE TaxID=3132286 RepID=UPI0039A2E594
MEKSSSLNTSVSYTWSQDIGDVSPALRYVSSDPTVATVTPSGVITAVAPGVARVGVYATWNGTTVVDELEVTVADSYRVRLFPVEDAAVGSWGADTVYGTWRTLWNKPGPAGYSDSSSYVKFDVSSLAGKSVTSAVLTTSNWIDNGPLDPARVDLHSVSDSWSESSVTYRNRPSMGPTVGSFLTSKTKNTSSANITSFIASLASTRTPVASLGMTQDNAGGNAVMVYLDSRESTSPPYLDVTFAPVTAAVPPALLGSVVVSNVPSSIEKGSTVSPTVSVKDSTGQPLSGATVTYAVANTAVAMVASNGAITGVSPGTTTLTTSASAAGLTAQTTTTITVADSYRVRLFPVEDAAVGSWGADTVYGTWRTLWNKPGPAGYSDSSSYVKFDVSSLAGKSVTSAVLTTSNWIDNGPLDPARVDLHSVSDSWSESSVTYRNRPSMGPTVGSFLTSKTKNTSSANITSFIASLASTRTPVASLGMTQDNAGGNAVMVYLDSRESTSPPYLDVTFAPVTAAVPPALLGSVVVSNVPSSIEKGSTVSPTVSVKDSTGQPLSGATVTYAVANTAVAMVASNGAITGVSPGTTTLTTSASAAGLTAQTTTTITVADSYRVRLFPVEDAAVGSWGADTVYGTWRTLWNKPGPAGYSDSSSYVKFDVSSLAGKSVTSAVLTTSNWIDNGPLDPARVDLHSVSDSWSESSVTYRNRPSMGPTVGSFLTSKTKNTSSANITSFIASLASTRTPVASLGMTQDNAGGNAVMVYLDSRESTSPPYLDVTFAPVTAAVPPALLGSVVVSNVPSSIEKGSTVSPTVSVKDSTGQPLSGATVTYAVANTAVAMVASNGAITGVSPGTTTLTTSASAAGLTAQTTTTITVADSYRVRLFPVEDAAVGSWGADTVYGTWRTLWNKPGPAGYSDSSSYVKFDVSSLAGKSVTSAVLTTSNWIDNGPLDPARVDLHSVSDSWSESSVTYRNRPSMGPTVGSFLTSKTKNTSSANITSFIASLASTRTPVASLGMTQDNAGGNAVMVYLDSRESTSPPYLDVTFAPVTAAVPPALLGSVVVSNVPSSIEKGSTVSPTVSVKDSTGQPLSGATVTYAVANTAVAMVASNGAITGVSPGTTTLTTSASAAGLTAQTTTTITVADSYRVRLFPVEDAAVGSWGADTVYGTWRTLWNKPGPAGYSDSSSYVKFDVSSLAGKSVTSAVLTTSNWIDNGPLDPARVDLHSVSDSWSESSVTYRNRPSMGPTVGSFLTSKTKNTSSANITSFIASLASTRTPVASLGMTQDNAGGNAVMVYLDSRESTSPPYLDVTFAPVTAAVPPALLGSVVVSNVPSSIEKGSTVSPTVSVKDSTGQPLSGATVTYAVANTAVAMVASNGAITGVSPGTTTLTTSASAAGLTAQTTTTITVVTK